MKFLIGLLAFSVCGAAYGFETHASITGSMGHDFQAENSLAKLGLVLSAPVMKGLGWWSYTGVGSTVEDKLWAAHSQGIDFSHNRITSGLQVTVSKDPDHLKDSAYPLSKSMQVNLKVKLW